MKRFYFVRHGESEGNVGKIIQGAATPLTEKGKNQAKLIAKRVADLEIDHIVSSTMVRAKHTAEEIAATLKKDIEFSDLFVERLRPSESYGMDSESDAYKKIDHSIIKNWHQSGWRHSDEENFEDLRARAESCLSFLKELPHTHVLVVTHGLFLRALLGAVIFADEFSSRHMEQLIITLATANTGITLIDYDTKYPNRGWLLRTFNDYAHLPH